SPIPRWATDVPTPFEQTACIEVKQQSNQPTLECEQVASTDTDLSLTGTFLDAARLAAVETAIGPIPKAGLVLGKVVDSTGGPASGVVVTPLQGTVVYLSDDMTSTTDAGGAPLTATTSSGAFVSTDAPFEFNGSLDTWTAMQGTLGTQAPAVG